MLQINTGKLFHRGIGHKNELRGILYSNGWLIRDEEVVTKAGILKAAGSGPKDRGLVYELVENIEEEEKGTGVLISHTVTPYLNDFSFIASFAFDVVVTPDHDMLSKLISDGAKHSASYAPDKFVKRFFDNQANILDAEIDELICFVDELLGLERNHYLGSMRAIRTYIAALHSISSDPARAYTLMVSAVETLTQEFDGYQSVWTDVEERKRKAIDDALFDIESDAAEKIRHAILDFEHVSLSRRYREFVSSKIEADFFRVEGSENGRSIARWEVSPALKQAYGMRSQYIHSAKPLPYPLTMPHEHWEVSTIERRPALTLQGLKRITRHVIRQFVRDGPKTETESYDYSLERAGIVQLKLAPQYWVGKPLNDAVEVRRRLEGFLQQLSSVETRPENATLTDLRPMIADMERLFPQSKTAQRISIYALHVLFNLAVSDEKRSTGWQEFLQKHDEYGSKAEPEIVICRTFLGDHNWPLETHKKAFEKYWSERATKSGIHAPRLFEAAMALDLAERYRLAGEVDTVRAYLKEAVESFPDSSPLQQLEAEISFDSPIEWRSVLTVMTANGLADKDG